MKYGLQMFSVRDIAGKDLLGSIRQVAELGYGLLEFAGFFGCPAEDVKKTMDECGVTVFGTHTGWQEIAEQFEKTVAYHKAIGNKNIIIPGADLSTKEKLDAFIDMVNGAQPRLAREGIRLGYHNHSHEFAPNQDGQIIYDELLKRTKIDVEIDTYWAYNAGKDPVVMMEGLKERLISIHIKDGFMGGEGKPLGQGTAPVKAVYEKVAAMGIPMVVESETLTPDGITEARVCIEYLRSLEK